MALTVLKCILRPAAAAEWTPVGAPERALALDVLQGACHTHAKSKAMFAKADGLAVRRSELTSERA